MKARTQKKLRKLLIVVVVLIAILFAMGWLLGYMTKKGIETIGSQIAGVVISLDRAYIAPWSGNGRLYGLIVGNPPGFNTPTAIKVETININLNPLSVFSPTIRINSIVVNAPEITFEGSLSGSNLSRLHEQIKISIAATGDQITAASTKSTAREKKIKIRELLINDGKINVSATFAGGKSATLPLPNIRLTDLGSHGTTDDGMNAGELCDRLLDVVSRNSLHEVRGKVTTIGDELMGHAKRVLDNATEKIDKASQKIGDFFK